MQWWNNLNFTTVLWGFLIVVKCTERRNSGIQSQMLRPERKNLQTFENFPPPRQTAYESSVENLNRVFPAVTNKIDFIAVRNKRQAHSISNKPLNVNKEAVEFIDIRKHLPEIDELSALNKMPEANISKPEMQHRTDTLSSNRNFNDKPFHESRGITKEQWVKQPYPVHSVRVDDSYHDSTVLPNSGRAPSVRFVTQSRLDPEASPTTRSYEREGRLRDFSQNIVPAPGDTQENIRLRGAGRPDVDFYQNRESLYPPYNRNFYPGDHPYYRYQESFYEPRYRPFYERERPEYNNRQRRIIYYATLPEVVRTPPNVNLREKYNYRDIYDNRYGPVSEEGLYRGDRFLPPKTMHYTDVERTKLPYSLKVQTDVNVQAVKKNPERRTYSEPDRTRYVYDAYGQKNIRDLE